METEPVFDLKSVVSSPPAGYRFPREVIAVAVRWYLRYGLSYRDVEELLAERGIEVDHVTVYRWVQTFTSEFIDAARPARHSAGDRWFVDETYVKIAGRWTYLYRAVDQHGQVIDVLLSERLDGAAGRPGVLHPRADSWSGSGRGDHRPGTGLPTGHRRARAACAARPRAVRVLAAG
jgi:DDE domain